MDVQALNVKLALHQEGHFIFPQSVLSTLHLPLLFIFLLYYQLECNKNRFTLSSQSVSFDVFLFHLPHLLIWILARMLQERHGNFQKEAQLSKINFQQERKDHSVLCA